MKKLLPILYFLFCTTGLLAQPLTPKMKTIFNAQNFKNWIEPEDNIYWNIKDGILNGKYGPNKTGSILWTKKKYKDFVIQLDFKLGDETIGFGIILRGDGLNAPQIQIGESGSLNREV